MSHKPSPPLWRNIWLKSSYGVLTGMIIVLLLGIMGYLAH